MHCGRRTGDENFAKISPLKKLDVSMKACLLRADWRWEWGKNCAFIHVRHGRPALRRGGPGPSAVRDRNVVNGG
jgi:hypothetical protein